jgi:protein-glutamine gamma-glutamyltransferase
MNLLPLYHRLLLLVMLLGISAYGAAEPAPLLALTAIPAAWVLWRLSLRPGKPMRLPLLAVNLLLSAAVAFAIYRSITRSFDVAYVAELVVIIQLIKLTDRRSPRDDAQILLLAVFLAIAAMLTSNTLWVGAILAAFLPLLIAAVILFQLYKGDWTAQRALASDTRPLRAGATASFGRTGFAAARPDFGRHFRRTVGFATLGSLLAAFVVFILIPRGIGESVFGPWGQARRASVTGFADRVSLGSRGVISTSPTVVLDLMVREYAGGSSVPRGSTESVHYLRGAVLDSYANGVWSPSRHLPDGESKRLQAGVDLAPGEELTVGQPGGPLVEQIITLRSTSGDHRPTRLFAAWRPIRIQVMRRSRLTVHFSDGLFERTGESGPLTYTVWSGFVDPRRGPPEVRTPAGFDSQPIHELASLILLEAGMDPDPVSRPIAEDSRAARAIQDHLRANYEYTLDEPYIPPDAHPIEYFLFSTRRGHCEYFASAMVAMCRSVGIYARIITGYVAAEFNQASGHYIVREANAHAWVEAEAGRNLWRRFDPTPPSDLVRIHRPEPSMFGRLRQMLDAVEFAWNSTVVGFDAGRRERLLGASRVRNSDVIRRIDSYIASPRTDRSAGVTGPLARLALAFMILAIPAAAMVAFWRRLSGRLPRGFRRKRAHGRRPTLEAPFYTALLEALRKHGYPKPPWKPPLSHAATLPSPELVDPAAELVRLYYSARFADQVPTPSDLQHAEQLLARITALRKGSAGE